MPGKKRLQFADDITAAELRLFLAMREKVAEKRRADERAASAEKRAALLAEFPHPLALAQHFDETVVSTPAIEHISRVWVDVLHEWDGRAQISLGPQQGKARWPNGPSSGPCWRTPTAA